MNIEISVASGERPSEMRSPARPTKARNGGGREGGNREGGQRDGAQRSSNRNRGEARPARRPIFADGEAALERGEGRGNNRPARNRNEDFRGQRRGEESPRFEPENDLADTSDFAARKKQFGGPQGEARPHRSGKPGAGKGAPGPSASIQHMVPMKQVQSARIAQPGRPGQGPAKSGNGGPVKFGGGEGQQKRRDRA